MTKPLSYYAGARSDHPDADILDQIQEQFGVQLQEVSNLSKAAVLICLVEGATNTPEVFIEPNFFTSENGGELWQLAQQLSESNQLMLALAIMNQLVDAGR